ncbi:hypothetical protein AB0L22_09455 [Micromonospora haikouensis]|uniref:hypothetical protein n=1 Tax=Micromonospora haikouensis TaxID=686309 RepID=UPI00342F2A36
MTQHAVLTIDAFYTTLSLAGRHHNLLGDDRDGDWNRDHIGCFRNAADRHLTSLGYTRTGDWQYSSGRNAHTATIAAASAARSAA